MSKNIVKPLEFKPDMEDAVKRWDAFYAGEMIDRPVVCITSPKRGSEKYKRIGSSYRKQLEENIDTIIDDVISDAQNTFYGGENIPAYYPSLGPDEVAFYCGAEMAWQAGSDYTNWSVNYVDDWEKTGKIEIKDDNKYWQRILSLYKRGAERLQDKMLMYHVDLHTNMDLLAAIRGPENLCYDAIDCPELIDEAMKQSRQVFKKLWKEIAKAGKMDENGYWFGAYGKEGAAMLQCDFGAMISPDMFKRWVIPALEEEAEIVKRVVYHWDGPENLRHKDALLACKNIYAMAYVPLPSEGGHIKLLDLLSEVQSKGKAAYVSGTPEEIKIMHKTLIPNKTIYNTSTKTQDEAEALLEWFTKNT